MAQARHARTEGWAANMIAMVGGWIVTTSRAADAMTARACAPRRMRHAVTTINKNRS